MRGTRNLGVNLATPDNAGAARAGGETPRERGAAAGGTVTVTVNTGSLARNPLSPGRPSNSSGNFKLKYPVENWKQPFPMKSLMKILC